MANLIEKLIVGVIAAIIWTLSFILTITSMAAIVAVFVALVLGFLSIIA